MADPKIISLPDMKQIEAKAANWLMRFEDGDASEKEQAEFRRWIAQSEQNKAAFLRLGELWGDLDALVEFKDLALSDEVVHSLQEGERDSVSWLPRRFVSWSIAASLIVVSLGVFYQFGALNQAQLDTKYATAIGEQKSIELPDGSSVLLNTDSSIEVSFSRSQRNIFLNQGEAFFEVAKDASRPFTVSTEKGSVAAVGTAFSVSLRGNSVDVVVAEGRVALLPASKNSQLTHGQEISNKTLMEITAGQSVAFSEQIERLDRVELDALEQELDWRDGVLSFKGEPLEQVVADISPYTALSIEIDGETLKRQPIGGYFKVGEIESLFEALSLMANVKVEHLDNDRIRLYRDSLESDIHKPEIR